MIAVSNRSQGWVSNPNAGSWTWAQLGWLDAAGEELPDHSRIELFRNELQLRTWQEHEIHVDDPTFLGQQPQTGAQLGLWIRSQFAGWQHYVRYASIKAVYFPPQPWPGFSPLFRD
jgi:hypothetical protein